jgi:hypothetical protein
MFLPLLHPLPILAHQSVPSLLLGGSRSFARMVRDGLVVVMLVCSDVPTVWAGTVVLLATVFVAFASIVRVLTLYTVAQLGRTMYRFGVARPPIFLSSFCFGPSFDVWRWAGW